MLTPQDVRAAQFEKNIRGYRTEEVDRFLDKVEEQLKQDEDQAEELRRQIAELTAENQRLHKEMESYEADGDMLKSALINAQRMGENVIREANQKSEEILHMQICAGMILSAMPMSCSRRPVTARMRSSTKQTIKSWQRSASMTASVWKSPVSSPTCSTCTAAMSSL